MQDRRAHEKCTKCNPPHTAYGNLPAQTPQGVGVVRDSRQDAIESHFGSNIRFDKILGLSKPDVRSCCVGFERTQ